MIDISVIIINFNSSQYTIECVNSIIKQTSKSLIYEIIIVDNDSKIDDYNKLKSAIDIYRIENLKLYRNNVNAGFGGGNMYGFRLAIGNYIAFINNDVILINDCLSILKNACTEDNRIGVCGPTTITNDNRILPTLDFYASPLKHFFGRKIYKILRPKLYKQRQIELTGKTFGDFVSGSFMFLKSDVFNFVKGFDENIFLYHEETDLCKRLNKINLFAACIPQAKCFHYHGASTTKSLRIKAELKRSFLYVIRKHYGYFSYKYIQLSMQFKYAIKSIFNKKYRFLLNQISENIKLNNSTKVTHDISN